METTESKTDDDHHDEPKETLFDNFKNFLSIIWQDVKIQAGTVKFWVELVAVGGGLTYAGLTYNMWGEMQNQTRIQREINKPIIIRYSLGTYHWDEDKKMLAVMTVKNSGNTDAKFVSIAINSGFRNSNPEEPRDYRFREGDFKPTNPSLLPTYILTKKIAEMGNDLSQPLPSDEYSKGKRFYIWGKIRFQDSVGPLPESSFCEYATENVLDPKYNLVGLLRRDSVGYKEPYSECSKAQ